MGGLPSEINLLSNHPDELILIGGYVAQSQDLPEDADYRINNPLDEWFEKFLAREDLLEWMDAPLEAAE